MADNRSPEREYRTDRIAVTWEPAYCIHTGNCIRGVPAVFNPADRPWVRLDPALADEVARAISTCPTGALHFQRLDDGPQEPVPEVTTIVPMPDGPLFVRGNVTVQDEDGTIIRQDTRMALCRCGQSAHKPFCDNTHRLVGFRTDSVAPDPSNAAETAGGGTDA